MLRKYVITDSEEEYELSREKRERRETQEMRYRLRDVKKELCRMEREVRMLRVVLAVTTVISVTMFVLKVMGL